MHWTQDEEKKRKRRKRWVVFLAGAGGLFFGVWQQSVPAGLFVASVVVLLESDRLL